MNSIETPQKGLTPEEKRIEAERVISVEIERRIMEKYVPLLMLKNKELTLEKARLEWIKKYAVSFRYIFNSNKVKILEMYHSNNGLEKAADYMEEALEAAPHQNP